MDTFNSNITYQLLGFALSASPWVLGATIARHFTRHKTRADWAGPVSVGIGGYVGYLALAALIWACEKLAVNILNPNFVYSLGAIAWLYALLLVGTSKTGPISNLIAAVNRPRVIVPIYRIADPGVLIGALMLLTLLLCSAFHHSLLPLHGWDGLDLWGLQAAEIIELQGEERVFENRYYHPQTLSIILAWSAYSSALVSTAAGQWPWFLSALSIALIIFGHSRRYDQSILVSSIIAYVVATIPLLENHSYLFGYGELFVSVALLGACTSIDTAIENDRAVLGALGCLLAFSALALKNIGPFYFFIIFSSYLLIMLLEKSKFATLILVLSASLLIVHIFSQGASFHLITQTFSFSPHEGKILFGGKLLTIITVELSQITEVFITALFRNSSFGIMPYIFVLAAVMSRLYGPLVRRRLAFLQLTILFGICGIAASLFTDYGLRHAVPGNDTGNSRFMLPIMVLSALLVAPCLRQLSERASPSI